MSKSVCLCNQIRILNFVRIHFYRCAFYNRCRCCFCRIWLFCCFRCSLCRRFCRIYYVFIRSFFPRHCYLNSSKFSGFSVLFNFFYRNLGCSLLLTGHNTLFRYFGNLFLVTLKCVLAGFFLVCNFNCFLLSYCNTNFLCL